MERTYTDTVKTVINMAYLLYFNLKLRQLAAMFSRRLAIVASLH